jgi:Fe-S-cluster-containing hydrogenase component 2
MPALAQHPTVRAIRSAPAPSPVETLSAAELRQLCLDAGADDVGFVALDRPELDDQRDDILRAFPSTRILISIVCRMNRDPVRSPERSASNLEFHQTTDHVNEAARAIVTRLADRGIGAMNPSSGFPMEMDRYPGKIWVVSHKPVAVAAGLGQIGVHRNVIHPKFGNFIILGTILVAADVDVESHPIDYNPCLECKLCVAACPVGAIKNDGQFDPSACITHNYREFMGGFLDLVDNIADSKGKSDFRERVSDQEIASFWQSLSFGPNYKAAYCLAVCPAGEDVIRPFLDDRPKFLEQTVKPLQKKSETIYVTPGSDAEEYVAKRFPHKRAKQVRGIRPVTIAGFLFGLRIVFQAGKSKGLDAVYHFTFTGAEPREATVTIRDQRVHVERGLVGKPDCAVTADSKAWLKFLRKETSLLGPLLTRKIRIRGRISLLPAFGRCFP